MRHSFAGSLFIASNLIYSSPVFASDYTGFCVDNVEDGCSDRFLPFEGLTLPLCEENCTLTNPVEVRGFPATLYEFKCKGDGESQPDERVMILTQTGYDENVTILFVDKRETRKIVRC